MKTYEKPWAELVSFESEAIMDDDDLVLPPGFSGVDEGVEDWE